MPTRCPERSGVSCAQAGAPGTSHRTFESGHEPGHWRFRPGSCVGFPAGSLTTGQRWGVPGCPRHCLIDADTGPSGAAGQSTKSPRRNYSGQNNAAGTCVGPAGSGHRV